MIVKRFLHRDRHMLIGRKNDGISLHASELCLPRHETEWSIFSQTEKAIVFVYFIPIVSWSFCCFLYSYLLFKKSENKWLKVLPPYFCYSMYKYCKLMIKYYISFTKIASVKNSYTQCPGTLNIKIYPLMLMYIAQRNDVQM